MARQGILFVHCQTSFRCPKSLRNRMVRFLSIGCKVPSVCFHSVWGPTSDWHTLGRMERIEAPATKSRQVAVDQRFLGCFWERL